MQGAVGASEKTSSWDYFQLTNRPHICFYASLQINVLHLAKFDLRFSFITWDHVLPRIEVSQCLFKKKKKHLTMDNDLISSGQFATKVIFLTLTSVAQWVGCHPTSWCITSLIPGQGTRVVRGSWSMFLSFSFSLPFSFSKNK